MGLTPLISSIRQTDMSCSKLDAMSISLKNKVLRRSVEVAVVNRLYKYILTQRKTAAFKAAVSLAIDPASQDKFITMAFPLKLRTLLSSVHESYRLLSRYRTSALTDQHL